MSAAAVLPLHRAGLAGLLREVVEDLLPTVAPLRVGVDGLAQDARAVADDLADELSGAGLEVLRVSTAAFLRPRSLRLEWGPPEADDLLTSWFDDEALVREVLAPLGPGGDRHWVDGLRDPVTDRSLRRPSRLAGPRAVLVLDGPLLARRSLDGGLDLVVRLVRSRASVLRRLDELADAALPGGVGGPVVAAALEQLEHLEAERSGDRPPDIEVRFDHPDRPAVGLPASDDDRGGSQRPAARLLASLSARPATPPESGRRTTAR